MSNRYEREIEELLKRMEGGREGSPRPEPLPRRRPHRTSRVEAFLHRIWRGFLRSSPIEQFMIAGVVLALLSAVLQTFSARAAFYAGVISVVLFVLALTISVVSRRRGGLGTEKKWRGRPMNARPSTPFWWLLLVQLRRWWQWRRPRF